MYNNQKLIVNITSTVQTVFTHYFDSFSRTALVLSSDKRLILFSKTKLCNENHVNYERKKKSKDSQSLLMRMNTWEKPWQKHTRLSKHEAIARAAVPTKFDHARPLGYMFLIYLRKTKIKFCCHNNFDEFK